MNDISLSTRDPLNEVSSKTVPFPDWRVMFVKSTEVVVSEEEERSMSGCAVRVNEEMFNVLNEIEAEEGADITEQSVTA